MVAFRFNCRFVPLLLLLVVAGQVLVGLRIRIDNLICWGAIFGVALASLGGDTARNRALEAIPVMDARAGFLPSSCRLSGGDIERVGVDVCDANMLCSAIHPEFDRVSLKYPPTAWPLGLVAGEIQRKTSDP